MKALLLAALVALTFPACERQSSRIALPSSTSPALVSGKSLPDRSELVINIDQHGGRVINERHYDSDSALGKELIRLAARWKTNVTVVLRADKRVCYDTIAKALLLIREAGFSEVCLAIRLPDSPLSQEHLRVRY